MIRETATSFSYITSINFRCQRATDACLFFTFQNSPKSIYRTEYNLENTVLFHKSEARQQLLSHTAVRALTTIVRLLLFSLCPFHHVLPVLHLLPFHYFFPLFSFAFLILTAFSFFSSDSTQSFPFNPSLNILLLVILFLFYHSSSLYSCRSVLNPQSHKK